MNVCKCFVVGLLFCIANITATFAQAPSDADKKMAKKIVAAMKVDLMLSVKQTELVENKMAEYSMKKKTIFMSKDDMEIKNKQLKELDEWQYSEMKGLLDEEQYKKYIATTEEVAGK